MSGFANDPTLPPRDRNASGPARGEQIRYFGDYEILAEIARGGMGVVYKARQVSLDRIVALKMILAGQLAAAYDVDRFYSEARAIANLQHRNIVAIHEVGQYQGQHYFSMDYVEGKSLAALLESGPLPPTKAAEYLKTIAEAVEFAHQHGILHRDLKPSNILIDSFNQPRVTDFGIAKRIGAREIASGPSDLETPPSLTAPGDILGTPSYMAPEQVEGNPAEIGPAADVYALGAMFYELLTGRPPFRGKSVRDTLLQVLQSSPVELRRLNRRVPKELERICLKCLQKEPRDRYASSGALAADLERYLLGQPTRVAREGAVGRFAKIAIGCALVMFLFCGGLFFVGRDLVRRGIKQFQQETETRARLFKAIDSWKAPAAHDPAEALFPKSVAAFKLADHADNVTIPDLQIEIPGRRARYESPSATVDFYVFPVAAADCDKLFKGVEERLKKSDGHSLFRADTDVFKRFRYSIHRPLQKGTLLWHDGWILLARTDQDDDPDDFLIAYLEASHHK